MALPENSSIIPNIKRSSEILSIHNLLIFNRSGICIYGLNLTNLFKIEQEQLISSYFAALMSFTTELIGEKIKSIEMGGGVKIVIFEKVNLYYGLLCDIDENIIVLESIVSKLHKKFNRYTKKHNVKTDMEYIYDNKLDDIIRETIKKISSKGYNLEKEEKVIDYLKQFEKDDQLSEIIFLTDLGKIIYTSARNKLTLKKILKEVDFRVKICNNNLLKLFYTLKENELIFSEYFNEMYLIILVFESKTKFGIAEFYLHRIVNQIRALLAE